MTVFGEEGSEPGAGGVAERVSGPVNLRDVGGLPLLGGGLTATDVLYRGDAPYAGDLARPDLRTWPPADVIDLRGVRERERFAYRWPTESAVHHLPMYDAAAPDSAPTDLAAVFLRMLGRGEIWTGELLRIVAHSRGPTLIHCTAGKDRTGVAVATLLLAAGVEPAAVVDDFVRTEAALADLYARWIAVGVRRHDSPSLPEKYMHAPAEALEPVVEQLVAARGGAGQWMIDRGGNPADLALWRARLREHGDVPSNRGGNTPQHWRSLGG